MALDGWSNVHNEPIICVSVLDLDSEYTYLIDSFDTVDESHTSKYLTELAARSIKKCQQEFGCTISSFVTDNAANMVRMRNELGMVEHLETCDIITYGCSAHFLNLLAHDIELPGVKEHVKQIVKYFRNHHHPAAKYKQAGGKTLKLPSDVRWNTLADCIETYLENWPILVKVCSENRTGFDATISAKVNNLALKINAQDYLKKLKLVAVALDKAQRDICTIGEVTEVWIHIMESFENNTDSLPTDLQACHKRLNEALTPPHYVANLTDSRFQGLKLNEKQLECAMQYIAENYAEVMPEIINYQAKSFPFKSYLFVSNTTANVKPLTWWAALERQISKKLFVLMKQLHSATASSAGIERVFSTYGLVHSKLRNCLGNEKAAKLVGIYKNLNPTKLKNQLEQDPPC